jgi:hypothetical protein
LLLTPGAYLRRKHLEGPPVGFALALPSNSKTLLESVSKDKCSSLSGVVISDKEKKFYNIDSRSQNPFECKDIKIALTEIGELHDKVEKLENDKRNKIR